MTKLNGWQALAVAVVMCSAMATTAESQVFTNLVNFNETNGQYPADMALIQTPDGGLIGTTEAGGNGWGNIFRLSQDGKLSSLHDFDSSQGGVPTGTILLNDGSLYGTTVDVGPGNGGTVYKLSSGGALTTIYSFCAQCGETYSPVGPVAEGIDGNLYGATSKGGLGQGPGAGAVFKVTQEGAETILHMFHGFDGQSPWNSLVQATDGNFYGITQEGGPQSAPGVSVCRDYLGCGTVFRVDSYGRFETLHYFCLKPGCTDGYSPQGGLVQAADGNFYGTTSGGGDTHLCAQVGCGTVFRITPSGEFTTLHTFVNGTDGAYPIAPLIQATDGQLYGTASQTIFRITTDGVLTTLHRFSGVGAFSSGGLLQATNGIFYGTTVRGGDPDCGCGSIFSLDVGLGPFVAFVQPFGKVDQTGGILGQGFTGTTSVSFNGVPAQFEVRADTFLTATVPEGATTGYVTVSTPTGVLTSNVPFQVIQ